MTFSNSITSYCSCVNSSVIMLTSFLLPSRPFDMLTMTAKPRGLCWTSSYTSSSAVDVTSFVYCFAVSLLCPFRLCDDDRSPNSAPSDDSLSANVQFGSQSSRLGQQLLPFKVDNTMFQLLWLSYTHLPEDLNVQ